MRRRYRQNLRSSVAASAAPYGYTLTVWSSGGVSMDVLGPPHVIQVLLFAGGAVLGFVLVEALAFGSLRVRLTHADPPTVAVWGNAHWLSVGASVVAVWAADRAIGTGAGWPLAGFLATALYLALNALQVTAATVASDGDG